MVLRLVEPMFVFWLKVLRLAREEQLAFRTRVDWLELPRFDEEELPATGLPRVEPT